MFEKDFIWGVATAAYQIEGAANQDGKGVSVWDVACQKENVVRNGENANIACDHYHHLEEDLDLLASLRVKAYRFSIAWTRIFPDGVGAVNETGVDFYDRLIDGLIKRGIRPIVTLFHWDYPQALFEKGGWLNEESPKWFADYAEFVVRRYGDRVADFTTLNEPQCVLNLGHRTGIHAPCVRYGDLEMARVAYNMLKAHGLAVRRMRAVAKRPLRISISIVGNAKVPFSSAKEDILAAKNATFSLDEKESSDLFWMDIIYKGVVSDIANKGEFCALLEDGDLQLFSEPLDYFCVNMYASNVVKAVRGGYEVLPKEQGAPMNSLRWNIVPEVLYWGTKFYYERYQKPIIISENGYCGYNFKTINGNVLDFERINFIQRYLLQVKRAKEEKVDVAGYFYWSFMDNFEWSHGYDERFGLIYVDYETQERTVKASGEYYRKIIETNGDCLNESIKYFLRN